MYLFLINRLFLSYLKAQKVNPTIKKHQQGGVRGWTSEYEEGGNGAMGSNGGGGGSRKNGHQQSCYLKEVLTFCSCVPEFRDRGKFLIMDVFVKSDFRVKLLFLIMDIYSYLWIWCSDIWILFLRLF